MKKLSWPSWSAPQWWPLGRNVRPANAPAVPEEGGLALETGQAMVDAGWAPPLDLLEERRRQLELEPLSGLIVQRPGLLRRGLLAGGVILGASAGLCGLLLIWHQLVKTRMGQLERYETEAAQLTKELAGHRAALKRVKTSNEGVVKRLTDVRSSSALLADLQLRVPEGVQLTEVQMEGADTLRLAGVARDPVGFGRVNALELVLRKSPLMEAKGVSLVKVERVPERKLDVKTTGPARPGAEPLKFELPSAVAFEMKATLTPLAANRLIAVMEGLNAEGMVRRLETLEREGLLQ